MEVLYNSEFIRLRCIPNAFVHVLVEFVDAGVLHLLVHFNACAVQPLVAWILFVGHLDHLRRCTDRGRIEPVEFINGIGCHFCLQLVNMLKIQADDAIRVV